MDEEMLVALDKAAAAPILERSAQGLDTRVSGGERKRLSIARALRQPRLFFFDEATTALDSMFNNRLADQRRRQPG